MELSRMTEEEILTDVELDEVFHGVDFARAGERALKPGDTIYNFQGNPATITRVLGRRFIWATSDAYPEPRLIDWRAFTTTPDYDENQTLVELVCRHETHHAV